MERSSPSPSDLVYVHADESCLGLQFRDRATPGGAAGLVEVFGRHGWIRRELYVSEPDTTNNRMALRSAIEVLQRIRAPSGIAFYSDSRYLVQGMQEWVHAWAARGWKRKGGTIENAELWHTLVELARRHRIQWRWLRGHAGHPKNEYVNRLAIRAAERQLDSGGLIASGFDRWLREEQKRGRFLRFEDVPASEPFVPDPAPPAAPARPLMLPIPPAAGRRSRKSGR